MMRITRPNSAPVKRPGDDFSFNARRAKSASHSDENASAPTRRAIAHRVEEEKSASPAQNTGERTRPNRFLMVDVLNDEGPSEDGPFYTSVRSLQELNESAQMIPRAEKESGDPAYPLDARGSHATDNPLRLPAYSMESQIPLEINAGEMQIEQAEGIKVDILFTEKTFNSNNLKDALSNAKGRVSEFLIDISHCQLTNDDIKNIADFLDNQRENIKKFSCGLPECNKFNGAKSIAPILDALFKTEHLTELVIDLRNSGFTSDNEALLRITDILNTHKNLSSLTVAVQKNCFTKEVISLFFSGLAQLKELNTAVLSFPESHNIDEEVLRNVFLNLQEMTSVRELQLAVQNNEGLNDRSISALCESLPALKNIEMFALFVRDSKIDGTTIQKVLDATQAWGNLRGLYIDACYCPLDAEKVRQSVAEFAAQRHVDATIKVTYADDMATLSHLAAQRSAELEQHGLRPEDA